MCSIYLLQTAGLHYGTDRQGRPSVNTHFTSSVCACMCDILAAVPSLAKVPRAENLRARSPFPSAPALLLYPGACLADRRGCHGDGWPRARFLCRSPPPLLPAGRGPVKDFLLGQLLLPTLLLSVCIRNRRNTMEAGGGGFMGKIHF